MSSDHMSSVQSNEVVCLPQEPQVHNEAQNLLLLQDYVTLLELWKTPTPYCSKRNFLQVLSTSKTAETFAQPAVA